MKQCKNIHHHRIVGLALLLGLLPAAAWSATTRGETMDWLSMGMGLFGGLAREQMKTVLAKLTTNRFTGAVTGAMVTAVIQSSSVTTVLVVGFVSAGLMSLSQSIGVIMGANIGTTITAQIVAFKVVKFALAFIAIGFAMLFFSRQEKIRSHGGMLMGLGMVFFGMSVMSETMHPLRSYQPFLELVVEMERPLLGILVGGLFTALVQSSSATTGIVIVMASQGFITLPAGIALALGANIGTCVTALLASIGKPRAARRAAAVHVIFNVFGVLIWLGFIDQLSQMAVAISPIDPELSGLTKLAAESPRQIANANTLFNLANTMIFIAFTGPMARLVTWLLPDRMRPPGKEIIRPRYLNEELLETPSLALNVARLEIGRLGHQILLMLAQTKVALETRDGQLFKEIEKMDDAADILHAAILEYLGQIGRQSLTESENEEYFRLTHTADNFESIGDVIETDLVTLGHKLINENLEPSETFRLLLATLHEGVFQALESAIKAVADNDQTAAQEVIALKPEIHRREDAAFKRQAESLAASGGARLATLRVEFEVTDKLKRIYSLTKRIVRLFLPSEV